MARTLAMFTDTSLCIGCRACQVACKQWNELPLEQPEWTGGYQNHVALHRQDLPPRCASSRSRRPTASSSGSSMSDVCKHCAQAGCLDACPTGAIYRTEFGTVNINQDVCNGCRYCVSSCPFGVVSYNHDTGRANKCTFCNDRIHNGLGPACAKTCPTESIQFGFRDELVPQGAEARGEAQGDGLRGRPALRRRQQRPPRRAQRLLPAARQAVHLPPARRSRSCPSATSSWTRCCRWARRCSSGWAPSSPSATAAERRAAMEIVKTPDWHLLIVWYFFIGGIAGGAYFTAAIADNFGSERDRGVFRIGYILVAAAHRPVRDPARSSTWARPAAS